MNKLQMSINDIVAYDLIFYNITGSWNYGYSIASWLIGYDIPPFEQTGIDGAYKSKIMDDLKHGNKKVLV